ncbi:MAG: PRC-barrel domain-containing protein [Bryobacterales bacterium]|nr:PRC-barrel domain-containing protein [Bryobacterales bacterium]
MRNDVGTRTPSVLSSSSINGDAVVNRAGESLGKIEDLMVDLNSQRVAYAVLSFGGFLGIGNKLFAVPFESLEVDSVNERFILDVPKERLENAPGFDKDNWPDFADRTWGGSIYSHYDRSPYWT